MTWVTGRAGQVALQDHQHCVSDIAVSKVHPFLKHVVMTYCCCLLPSAPFASEVFGPGNQRHLISQQVTQTAPMRNAFTQPATYITYMMY